MATALGSILVQAAVGAVSPAGRASADFGSFYNLVLALCAVNTIVCLYYLWRIFKKK